MSWVDPRYAGRLIRKKKQQKLKEILRGFCTQIQQGLFSMFMFFNIKTHHICQEDDNVTESNEISPLKY